jgi:3-hydroxyacyl-CoA dehydrogenase
MGHGICQVAATSGIHSQVVAFEQEQRFLDSGKDRILKSIDKLVEKEKMSSESAEMALGKIEFTTDAGALKDVDFVVEAVVENIDLKRALYTTLDDLCKPETVFASNTSSLSIGEMAGFSNRPDRFLGVHFFNPVQLMKVVEVIRTDETDPAILERGVKWVEEIGKVSVLCDDTPGFIVNRILVPSLMQAMALVDRKEASVKDIDVAMKLGCGHPMGPMHLADYIGLDTCHSIVKGWTDNYPDEPAFFIPICLQEKIDAGDLGRKSGKGFYHWQGDRRGDPVE